MKGRHIHIKTGLMRKHFVLLIGIWLIPLFSMSQLIIYYQGDDPRVRFGIKKIKEAAEARKLSVREVTQLGSIPAGSPYIGIYADSINAAMVAVEKNISPATNYSEQCYSLRHVKGSVFVLAGTSSGAMYGALDIAEALACGTLPQLASSNNEPYLKRRGIKYNIPMDLRTPTYSDPGDAHQQNLANTWDISFWQDIFDQMAIHRYNVMTWWSLQPFPSMVKIPEFPNTSLEDVWQTKEKYDDTYSSTAIDFDRPNLFKNVAVIKKMTIDQKIEFWKQVMQMAADRGIEIYLFTWNKFTYGINGKYGISNRQDNDTTIAWYRAAVREMIRTYPLLRGIGITAGEGMENRRTDEYSNEKWLWKTYGEGIRDGLKDLPRRDFTLVHRFHWASLKEIQTEFKDLPCKLEVSLKYAVAHMYALPDPPFILPAMPHLSKQVQSWLTIRNDDIYSFRWANHDFARSFIKSIPELEKIAGFYMGPDGYCWGRDYLSKLNGNRTPPLVMEKQWYSFMLWGRLSYNPELPDKIFLQHLPLHFPRINADELIKGWSAASMIFPWATRFVWGDIDLKWFPEANISHPRHKGFYTVKDYIEKEPVAGSNMEGILAWSRRELAGETTTLLSPKAVSDTLEKLSKTALASISNIRKPIYTAPDEVNQTLSDIEGFAMIGFYYSHKIRAASYLALFDTTKSTNYRDSSLAELRMAQNYWHKYAVIYSARNKPALYNRVGYVDVEKLKTQVQADIDMVQQWKPGAIKLSASQNTEAPFKN
jgi:hypothetical protein